MSRQDVHPQRLLRDENMAPLHVMHGGRTRACCEARLQGCKGPPCCCMVCCLRCLGHALVWEMRTMPRTLQNVGGVREDRFLLVWLGGLAILIRLAAPPKLLPSARRGWACCGGEGGVMWPCGHKSISWTPLNSMCVTMA